MRAGNGLAPRGEASARRDDARVGDHRRRQRGDGRWKVLELSDGGDTGKTLPSVVDGDDVDVDMNDNG